MSSSLSQMQYVKLCACGCGQPVPLAQKTCTARGYVKGEPCQFVRGHAVGRYEPDREKRAAMDLECRRRYKRERRARMKALVAEYLTIHPCLDCGEADPDVLDFDHRNPAKKVKSIADILAGALGIRVLETEITKCDIRCANCHRRKHAREFRALQEQKQS